MAAPADPIERTWRVREPSPHVVDGLVGALDVARPVAVVLANRGVTDPDAASRALAPGRAEMHPATALPDATRAVDRLSTAVEGAERVLLYADRDVDGVAGAVALARAFTRLEHDVEAHLPKKYDSFGLDEDVLVDAAHEYDLVVTVDCGTTDAGAIDSARHAGLECIVIDHHEVEDPFPIDVPFVNPTRPDAGYPNPGLAAGAIAYKVGRLLVETVEPAAVTAYDRDGLVLAALATLGDYVPLTIENRALVRTGFARLDETDLAGVRALADHCGVTSIRDLRWSLLPLLAAAEEAGARMFPYEVFLGRRDMDAGIEQLEWLRQERKRKREDRVDHLLDRVADDLEGPLAVIEAEQYVDGAAISRVAEHLGRPTIVYQRRADGVIANGRTDTEIDFRALFAACEDLLDDAWGHPGAAGFRTAADRVEEVCGRIRDGLEEQYAEADLRPTVEIDARLSPDALTPELIRALERLGPFGTGHPRPAFLLEGLHLERVRLFGDAHRHVAFHPRESDELALRQWNGRAAADGLVAPVVADLVGEPAWDTYQDRPALDIVDFRVPDGMS